MSNDLALLENQLRPLTPHFAEALAGTGLAPEKLIRTILVSVERTPALLGCERSSIIQSSMTAAILGLEADGVTGQFFMLPFKGKAQPVVGYKGYGTLAGRSGLTVNGEVVREGDFFEYELGSAPFVRHRPLLGGGRNRRIIAAWATASHPSRAPIATVLDIDDILFVKGRSPGARRSESPWNDEAIGFPAMASKTAKRRLARSLPLNLMVIAAAMEEAHEERGKHAFIHPERGLIVDGEAQEIAPTQPGPKMPPIETIERPRFIIRKAKADVVCESIEQWRQRMLMAIESLPRAEQIEAFRELNAEEMDRLRHDHQEHVNAVGAAFKKRLGEA